MRRAAARPRRMSRFRRRRGSARAGSEDRRRDSRAVHRRRGRLQASRQQLGAQRPTAAGEPGPAAARRVASRAGGRDAQSPIFMSTRWSGHIATAAGGALRHWAAGEISDAAFRRRVRFAVDVVFAAAASEDCARGAATAASAQPAAGVAMTAAAIGFDVAPGIRLAADALRRGGRTCSADAARRRPDATRVARNGDEPRRRLAGGRSQSICAATARAPIRGRRPTHWRTLLTTCAR